MPQEALLCFPTSRMMGLVFRAAYHRNNMPPSASVRHPQRGSPWEMLGLPRTDVGLAPCSATRLPEVLYAAAVPLERKGRKALANEGLLLGADALALTALLAQRQPCVHLRPAAGGISWPRAGV